MLSDIWIIAEQREGEIHPLSLEIVTLACEMATATGGTARMVVLGNRDLAHGIAEKLATETGLDVVGLQSEHLAHYSAEAYQNALAAFLAARRDAACVLIPHTSIGTDYAPGLAVRIGAYAVAGAVDVGWKDPHRPWFFRPICNGKLMARVGASGDRCVVATVMAGVRPAAHGRAGKPSGRVALEDARLGPPRSRAVRVVEAPPRDVELGRAKVIVAAGRGVGSREGVGKIEELASLFDHSVVGGSRTVCDLAWLPPSRQIGQTGQTVAPDLYLACGISGAVQHLVGMSRSGFIAAINKDRDAQIFSVADVGVVADLHEFLPVLTRKLKARRRQRSESG